jgi:hypothetical protein
MGRKFSAWQVNCCKLLTSVMRRKMIIIPLQGNQSVCDERNLILSKYSSNGVQNAERMYRSGAKCRRGKDDSTIKATTESRVVEILSRSQLVFQR